MASRVYLFRVTHFLLIAGTLLMLLLALLTGLGEGALVVAVLSGKYFGIPPALHDSDLPSALNGISRDTVFAVAIPLVGAVIVGALAVAAIFQLTAKIVESAILGDPFDGKNATRLSQIGWLLLGIQVAGTIGASFMQLMVPNLPLMGHGQPHLGDFGIDLGPQLSMTGILAVLLIFVLAQVFRRGSEMRAELEGTV